MNTTERPLITVVTRNVMTTLSREQVASAVHQLLTAKEVPDPENPGLWSTTIGGYTLWGILDRGAAPEGQDLFTVLFPEDY